MKVLAMAALFLLQQPRSAQPPSNVQQSPKSTIEGVVFRAGTGEPIPRARINITRVLAPGESPSPPTNIPPVTTDSQGKFVIKDLEAGAYRLVAQRNGFARQEYGERTPGRGGTVLNIQGGQAMKDVVFRLTPAGALGGRVTDPSGEPMAGLIIALLRSSYDVAGRRNYQAVGTARTDDRGEYRLYWVTPGRYFVSAAPTRSAGEFAGATPNTNEVTDLGYATTYYPGTADASLAATVEVQPGAELSTIDLTMVPQQVFSIRGRILDGTTGQPARNALAMLRPRRPFAVPLNSGPNYNPATGFEFRDVAPGQYWVVALLMPPPGAQTSNQPQSAQVPVDVSGSNIENLVVAVTRGISISGRVTVDGGASVSSLSTAGNLRVGLSPVTPDLQFPGSSSTPVMADGSFAVENVSSGEYRVSAFPMPTNGYIKSARLGNTDVLQESVSISGNVSGPLEVVLSTNAAQVDGSVVDKDQNPVRGIQAVLIPDRRDRRDLYKTVTTDQNGRFSFRNVAPGDYRLFAWEDLEQFAYNDPEILRRYEQLGNPLKISESARLTVEAKMIPAGQ